jgi:hypothetical protein
VPAPAPAPADPAAPEAPAPAVDAPQPVEAPPAATAQPPAPAAEAADAGEAVEQVLPDFGEEGRSPGPAPYGDGPIPEEEVAEGAAATAAEAPAAADAPAVAPVEAPPRTSIPSAEDNGNAESEAADDAYAAAPGADATQEDSAPSARGAAPPSSPPAAARLRAAFDGARASPQSTATKSPSRYIGGSSYSPSPERLGGSGRAVYLRSAGAAMESSVAAFHAARRGER